MGGGGHYLVFWRQKGCMIIQYMEAMLRRGQHAEKGSGRGTTC
jgi:hypothetical protein